MTGGGRGELEAGAGALRFVPDEGLRRETALHFVTLGGLRYNHFDPPEMIGGMSMTPTERMRNEIPDTETLRRKLAELAERENQF